MTPSQYPFKKYRYSQRDPRWANRTLGSSGLRMKDFGCVVTCLAYILSRFLGRDITPGDLLTWLNRHNGFTPGGLIYWTKIEEFTNGGLRYTTNPIGRTYTLLNVPFGRYSHFINELRAGLCLDSWDAKIKVRSEAFPKLFGKRYFKATVPPKT
jgi:hypothetical protein